MPPRGPFIASPWPIRRTSGLFRLLAISGVGKLPFNTDGGGLCNNHPVNRGGMTKIIEAVRQLRGEAHPKVQVPNCDLALAHGTGGLLGVRHAASTCILERA